MHDKYREREQRVSERKLCPIKASRYDERHDKHSAERLELRE